MKRLSRNSNRTKGSCKKQGRYEVVRIHYHLIHSVLPREAVKVERTDGRVFDSFEEAVEQARVMRTGGEYSYAPMEIDLRDE